MTLAKATPLSPSSNNPSLKKEGCAAPQAKAAKKQTAPKKPNKTSRYEGAAPSTIDMPKALSAHDAFLRGISGGQQLNLDALTLPCAPLEGLDLRDSRMIGAHMPQINLVDTDMSFSNLFGANFSNGTLSRAKFMRCDLRGVHMDYANLEDAILRYADFRDGFVMMRDADGVLCVSSSCSTDFENLLKLPNRGVGIELDEDENETYNSRLLVKGHTSLKYANISCTDLRGANFMGADLRGANLANADLTDADFQGCILHGSSFSGALIDNTNFAKADLRACDISLEALARANCAEVRMNTSFRDREASFVETLEEHSHWLQSKGKEGISLKLEARDLSNRPFVDTNFSAGNLRLTSFAHGNLAQCRFVKANLQWSIFADAFCNNLDFRGADLSKSVLRGGVFHDCQFSPALTAEPTSPDKSHHRPVRLQLANLEHTVFENCDFNHADFTRARLKGSVFRNCKLESANFKDADIQSVEFADCDLTGAHLPKLPGSGRN